MNALNKRAIERIQAFAACFVNPIILENDEEQNTFNTGRLLQAMGDFTGLPPQRVEALAEKTVLQAIRVKLDADPSFNHQLVEQVPHPALAQIVKLVRVRELTAARLVKRGGSGGLRYDITSLARTFYGGQILASIGLNRRRVVKADELRQIQAICDTFKLKLPEAVEPTMTDKYFAKHFGEHEE